MTELSVPLSGPWWGTEAHRAYLLADAKRQFAFFCQSLDPKGGFHAQDFSGKPIAGAARELHATTRMVHSFALAQQMGIEGAAEMVDHGMKALWNLHRDQKHGGYIWSFSPGGEVVDGQKLAYGHGFVLLAASSAKQVGHPEADRLLSDVAEVIDRRFWDHDAGRMKEEFAQDWSEISTYRGMNANMHSVEALLAATEATGDDSYAKRAEQILDFFVGEAGAQNDWRLPEHFTDKWAVDLNYEGNPMFRPAGATPGHAFEFSRLLLQAWDLGGRKAERFLAWSGQLYARAMQEGWDAENGGIFYTIGQDGKPLRKSRYWWPVTEAIGAASSWLKLAPENEGLNADYLLFWQTAERLFIDKEHGGWIPEVDAEGKPDSRQFSGKPDIYHALQADIYPLLATLANPVKETVSLR